MCFKMSQTWRPFCLGPNVLSVKVSAVTATSQGISSYGVQLVILEYSSFKRVNSYKGDNVHGLCIKLPY